MVVTWCWSRCVALRRSREQGKEVSVTFTFSPPGGPPFKKGGQNIAVARRLFLEMSRRSDDHRLYSKNIDFTLYYARIFVNFCSEISEGTGY